MTTPINTFAIISFSFGNEEPTTKYEKLIFKDGQPQSVMSMASALLTKKLNKDIENRNATDNIPTEYWIIIEDGQLVVEEFPVNLFVEQIDKPFAGPFKNDFSANVFLRQFKLSMNGE